MRARGGIAWQYVFGILLCLLVIVGSIYVVLLHNGNTDQESTAQMETHFVLKEDVDWNLTLVNR